MHYFYLINHLQPWKQVGSRNSWIVMALRRSDRKVPMKASGAQLWQGPMGNGPIPIDSPFIWLGMRRPTDAPIGSLSWEPGQVEVLVGPRDLTGG